MLLYHSSVVMVMSVNIEHQMLKFLHYLKCMSEILKKIKIAE